MRIVHVSSIVVPENRQRQEFSKVELEDLEKSILECGLIHAIAVQNDGVTLAVGERRWRAISHMNQPYRYGNDIIPAMHIPCVPLSELSEFDLYKIEFDENYRRQNLTWQETAIAFAKLKDMYAKQAEHRGEPLVVQDIAKDLGAAALSSMVTTINKNANIAPYLDDPDVAKAGSLKEAQAIVRKKQERILLEELNKRTKSTSEQFVCVHADSCTYLLGYESNTFNVILTDPPYGIDMHTMSLQGGSESGQRHDYEDSLDYATYHIRNLLAEGYRITTASAVMYMFCDISLWSTWAEMAKESGWYVWPVPLIWDKSPTGSLLGAANGPRHCYEAILMLIKGNKSINMVQEDVIKIPGPRVDKLHPAEKPVELYKRLLSWSTAPGDRVLDPFCGCGPIFPAARELKLIAHGIEVNPSHHAIAMSRITGVTA